MAHTPPQSGLALTDPGGFGFVVDQIRPVERSAREIAEAEYRAGGLQWSESLDGGPPPPIVGIDDDAGRQEKSGRP